MVSKGGSIIRGTLHRALIQAASGEGGEGGGWRVEGRDSGEGREREGYSTGVLIFVIFVVSLQITKISIHNFFHPCD